MYSLDRPTFTAVEHLRCTDTAVQYEIPPSFAHLFLTMRPQSPIDPALASISMFSSLVCQGKRLLCVYVCEYAYLHHHYYRSPHIQMSLHLSCKCLAGCDSTMHVCLHVFACALFFVSVTVCRWDQMWASLFAFPAVPEQVLIEPALSSRVDKQTIFKEREGENDSGPSKPDKFPPNTPSLVAPTVQRAGGEVKLKGKGWRSLQRIYGEAYILYSIYTYKYIFSWWYKSSG